LGVLNASVVRYTAIQRMGFFIMRLRWGGSLFLGVVLRLESIW